MTLVVSTPFGAYQRGDHISDPEIVKALLADERAAFVRVVAEPPAPPAKEG